MMPEDSRPAPDEEEVPWDSDRDLPLLNHYTREAKLARAIAYLRERNIYVLDVGAKKPGWGNGKGVL